MVKVLVKYGADIHKPLSASKTKNTPLILTAAQGELEMAKLLYQKGARVEEAGAYQVLSGTLKRGFCRRFPCNASKHSKSLFRYRSDL